MRYRFVSRVIVLLLLSPACESSSPAGTPPEEPFPVFPTQIESDTILFTADLDTRSLPSATPTSEFYSLVWNARNLTARTVSLEYCWLGIRMYDGSRIVWEDPTFSSCLLSQEDSIPPGGEQTIGTGSGPAFYIDQGVPEGRVLITVRWQLSGSSDTLEVQAGEAELRENNGLTPPEEPGAETKVFVSGRSRMQSGRGVRGFVGIRVHWEDCNRFPALWETIGTDVTGHFAHEATLREGIFDACISVLVQPFDAEDGSSKVVGAGRLRLRKPAPSGAARDSLQVEVIFSG